MDQQRELNEHQELRKLLTEVQKTQNLILRRLDLLEERLALRAGTAPGPFRRKYKSRQTCRLTRAWCCALP